MAQPERGLVQVSRSDPALVWSAPLRPGLHPAMGTGSYLLTSGLGSRITIARGVLPAQPVNLGTLTGDTNTLGPGDFHRLP